MLPGLSYKALPLTIASGASLSGAVALQNLHIVAIIMPSGWDAAALTFQASPDGTTFSNCYDANGTELTVQTAASRHIVVSPVTMPTTRQVKVRSGTAGSAVNQTADRTLTLICREYA